MPKGARITKANTMRTNLFIEPDLWRALRMQALEEGTTATDLLNHIIAMYVITQKRRRKVPLTEIEKAMERAERVRVKALQLHVKGAW